MSAERVLDWVGIVLMTALLIVGLWFFASGFRFLNPLDTAFRFVVGGSAAAGGGLYLYLRWRRLRRWRAIVGRINWQPSHR